MRDAQKMKWQQELKNKREFVEKSHSAVFDARRAKQSAVRARNQAEREHAEVIGQEAKVARAQRREQNKATVRAEEQAARDFAAKTRYETRPEVRQDSAEHFQAKRDQLAEEARQKAEEARLKAQAQRQAYLASASRVHEAVGRLHADSHASRQGLKEQRRQEAMDVRTKMEAERQRKAQLDEQRRQTKQALHDDIKQWKVYSVAEEDAYV